MRKPSLLALVFFAAADAVQAKSIVEIIAQERNRQISRQISDNIIRRVSGDIDSAFKAAVMQEAELPPNSMAASADSANSYMPDALWSTFSWSRIGNDGSIATDFATDIYQTTAGADKKFGDFYFGAALTYAYSDTRISLPGNKQDNSTHTVGITPYAAYVFNKHMFLSALSGYNYFNSSFGSGSFGSSPDSETDAYNTEIDLNGQHVLDNWFFSGKIGARFVHRHLKTVPSGAAATSTRDNSDTWTYLANAEGGYAFANEIRIYTGVLYEYDNPKPALGQADGVFYYTLGLDYALTEVLRVGAKAQTDLTNEDINLSTVILNLRLAL